jgi:hypothetical protein
MKNLSLYYYECAGQQAGPLAADQLVAQGVKATTLVWREGMSSWIPADAVPELRTLFAPSVPAPTQPALPTKAQPATLTRPRMSPAAPARSVFTGKNLLLGLVVLLAIGAEVASRVEPDAADSTPTGQQSDAPAQEEEVKEIGYAANHLHDEEVGGSSEETVAETPTASESAQADAIVSVDNNDGWLTVHYQEGTPRSFGVGKDPFFAYSPHLLVTHNERVSCKVMDIYGNQLTNGSTRNGGEACTGLRVVGDQIIIDVDTGHSTHQETYDVNLHLLRTSPSHMY